MSNDDLLEFLRSASLATADIPSGTRLWRIHSRDCVIDYRPFQDEDPVPHEIIHWSDSGRFGSPGNEVLYVGTTRQGSFLETMCSNPALRITISSARLANYACSAIDIPDTSTVVNLTKDGLLRNGLDANIFSATDPDSSNQRTYRFAQQVSAAIRTNPNNYDGLLYHSRVNPVFTNLALYFKSEDQYRRLQSRIEIAVNTLLEEPWVYEMQRDGFIAIDIMR